MELFNIIKPYIKIVVELSIFYIVAKLILKIVGGLKLKSLSVEEIKKIITPIFYIFIALVLIYIIPSLLLFLIFILPFIIIAAFGKLKGNTKALNKLNSEIKKVKLSNPYIYYREIPDDYGIGVYALLLDYKITDRDFKSALIDLAAKKHLKIETINGHFEVKILDKNTDILLENEKYILNWIRENDNQSIKKFDLSKWKKEIRKDIINLELGKEREDLKDESTESRHKFLRQFTLIPSIIGILIYYIYLFISNTGFLPLEKTESIVDLILSTIFRVVVNMPTACIVFIGLFIIFYLLGTFVGTFIFMSHDVYYFKMYDNLEYTDKTIETLHKIYSLGAFLKDFSVFAERNIEEIIIWERYFSYAYLLKLNDKLESKYTKIYKNENFSLDENIDKTSSIILK